MINTSRINLVTLIDKDTTLTRVAGTDGGEHVGPCPFCGGTDRLYVWPNAHYPHFYCWQCDRGGDAVAYVQAIENRNVKSALSRLGLDHPLARPYDIRLVEQQYGTADQYPRINDLKTDYAALVDADWQAAGQAFCQKAASYLHSLEGSNAYMYLREERRLTDPIIRSMRLGYNPTDEQTQWGTKKVWLPRGIVIPWWIDNRLWRVNFRKDINQHGLRYIQATGGANGLYGVDNIQSHCIIVLVEGEIDAMTLMAHVTPQLPQVIAIATGSTEGARVLRWLIALDMADTILLAFDNDGVPGERAATYWQEQLGSKAIRLRPTREDVNLMAQKGDDIVNWVRNALHQSQPSSFPLNQHSVDFPVELPF